MNVSSVVGQSRCVSSASIALHAVHRVFEARLLLGLEERVILEGVVGQVPVKRHLVLERGVPPLQLEMILNDLREHRRGVDGHEILLLRRHFLPAGGC